ncbi:MAG TPA: IS4 family transposase [Burkholderiaceae bacterium]|nr:IS4 family transposase [Burkholderiaceae bacterium]
MELGEALAAVGAPGSEASFSLFAQSLDPAWVEQALHETESATIRRRKLPAEYVIWLVIGMALLRDRSIAEVVRHLGLVMPTARGERPQVTGAAIVQARDRLGPEPLAWLFRTTAQAWAPACADEHRWRGLAVLGADGSTLRVPDTPENVAHFGRPGTSRGDAGAAYPQLRLVALMVLRAHLLLDVAFGSYRTSEGALADSLWPCVPPRSLVILDRGFATYETFHTLADPEDQRHWLTRAKQGPCTMPLHVIEELGPGDDLVELRPSKATRKLHPQLPDVLHVRAIHYQRKGFRAQILLTSLLDSVAFPADEIVALYHERWELELAYDEIKTHTLEREEASLRCRRPERIAQELWGLAIAYNLVRLTMADVARRAGVHPVQLSYRHALHFIRAFWLSAWLASPGTLPKRLQALLNELPLLLLPPRRDRTYPRAVKIKMSNYPRKRPRQRGNGVK